MEAAWHKSSCPSIGRPGGHAGWSHTVCFGEPEQSVLSTSFPWFIYFFLNFFILWVSLWWERVMGIRQQVGCRHLLGAQGVAVGHSEHPPTLPELLLLWTHGVQPEGGPVPRPLLCVLVLFPRPAHLPLLHQCLPGPSAVKWVLPFFNSLVRPGFYNLSYNNLFIFPHCLKELATRQTQPLFIKHFEAGRLMFLHSLELYFVLPMYVCGHTHVSICTHTELLKSNKTKVIRINWTKYSHDQKDY